MFGFHWAELLVILIPAILILGPKRLPEVGGAMGRGIRDFRRGVRDMGDETGVADIREQMRDVRETVLAVPRDLEASVRSAGNPADPASVE